MENSKGPRKLPQTLQVLYRHIQDVIYIISNDLNNYESSLNF